MVPYLSVTLWVKADSPGSGWQMSGAHQEMFLQTPTSFRHLPSAPSLLSHSYPPQFSAHSLLISNPLKEVESGLQTLQPASDFSCFFSPFIIPLAGIINLVPWEHKEVNNTPPSCGRLSITNDEGVFGCQGDAADWSLGIRGAPHDKRVHQDGWARDAQLRRCMHFNRGLVIYMWLNTKWKEEANQSCLVDVEIVV